ncbi:MAG: hypothetical protein IJ917_05915 [Firmicutes bacterium]|nr:hypothetical protein [Bacillota bacterium]
MNEMNRSAATGLDSPYADILDVPRHRSVRHAPMPLEERAAQFSPFAALSGHGKIIEDTRNEALEKVEHEIIRTWTEGDEPWHKYQEEE